MLWVLYYRVITVTEQLFILNFKHLYSLQFPIFRFQKLLILCIMFIKVNFFCLRICFSIIHEIFQAASWQFHMQKQKFIFSKDWAKWNNREINWAIFVNYIFSSKISNRHKDFSAILKIYIVTFYYVGKYELNYRSVFFLFMKENIVILFVYMYCLRYIFNGT